MGLANLEGRFATMLADPPWRFTNRTGTMAPEHKRLRRYPTMSCGEICELPVADHAAEAAHLYLWCPNALLADGLEVMRAWGFTYKTELVLFGVRGSMRTLPPGRRQVNLFFSRKQEHSAKPKKLYELIEACSPGPRLELFARGRLDGWTSWGDEVDGYAESRRLVAAYNGHAWNA